MAFRTVCLQEDDGGSERWVVCGGSTPLPGGRAAVACTLAAATPVELGLRPARWKGDQTQPVSAAHRDPVKDVAPASGTCCPHVEALVLHHEGSTRSNRRVAKEMCSQKMAVSLSQPPPCGATAAGGKSTQKKHPKKAPKKHPHSRPLLEARREGVPAVPVWGILLPDRHTKHPC